MTGTLMMICVLAASALVMACGVWVAVALTGAVWRMKRSGPASPHDLPGSTNG